MACHPPQASQQSAARMSAIPGAKLKTTTCCRSFAWVRSLSEWDTADTPTVYPLVTRVEAQDDPGISVPATRHIMIRMYLRAVFF